jgi:hypothetical protein
VSTEPENPEEEPALPDTTGDETVGTGEAQPAAPEADFVMVGVGEPENPPKPKSSLGLRIRRIAWRGFRIFSYLVYFTLVLVFGAVVALYVLVESPRVQNVLVPALNKQLAKALKTEVHFSRIEIELFDKIDLQDFVLKDQYGKVIFGAKRLRIGVLGIGLWKLITRPATEHLIAARLIELVEPEFNLYVRTVDNKLNLAFLFGPPKPKDTTKTKPFTITVEITTLRIVNGKLWVCDSSAGYARFAATPGHLNYKHVRFERMNFEGGVELFHTNALKVDIRHLSARELNSGLHMKHFQTNFWTEMGIYKMATDRYFAGKYQPDFEAINTKAHIGNSVLDFDFRMKNETMLSIVKKKHNRTYDVYFRPSLLHFETINYFIPAPTVIPPRGYIRFTGHCFGNYKTLHARNMKIRLGKRTYIDADVRLTNFTKGDIFFMDLKVRPSEVNVPDAFVVLPTVPLPRQLKNLGFTSLEGRFTGFFYDFVARGTFNTAIGYAKSDIHLSIDRKTKELTYNGRIETRDANLDSLLGVGFSSRLNFAGYLNGHGLKLKTAENEARFRMGPSTIRGVEIDSAQGSLTMNKGVIKGELRLRDNDANFNGLVDLDLSEATPTYKFQGDVTRVNLQKLRVTKVPLLLTSIISVDMTGDSLDNLLGDARLFKMVLERSDTSPSLKIEELIGSIEQNTSTSKSFRLKGTKSRRQELFDLTMDGDFSFSQAQRLVTRLINETQLFLLNDSTQIAEYYTKRRTQMLEPMNFNFALRVGEVNEVMNYLRFPLYIQKGSRARGRFRFAEEDQAEIHVAVDSAVYDTSFRFHYVTCALELSKPSYENKLTAIGVAKVSRLQIGKDLEFQQVYFRPSWSGESVGYNLAFRQDSFRNVVRLKGHTDYGPGQITNYFDPEGSFLQIGDSTWRVGAMNRVRLTRRTIEADSLLIYTATQRILINGIDTGMHSAGVGIDFQSLKLRSLNNFLPEKQTLNGEANARLVLRNVLAVPILELNGKVLNMSYAGLTYGDLIINSDWSQELNRLQLNARLLKGADTLIGVVGSYNPRSVSNSLNFILASDNLPLKLIQPFLKGILYNIDGRLDLQDLRLTGTLTQPVLRGYADVKASFGIDYFRTTYSLDHRVIFNETNIFFNDMVLRDARGSKAVLYGYVYHKGFSRFNFDIQFKEINNFLLVNTTKKDNSTYYGRMVVSRGFGFIDGTVARINITANVETGTGTEVNIPLGGFNEGQKLEYVYFLKRGGKGKYPRLATKTVGLNLNLTIDATPDATLRIIFDEKVGDIIKGQGNGSITLAISPGGEFTMNGQYTISEGNYMFTLQNFIRKEFLLRPGGTIVWNGDPLAANMRIAANYSRVASVGPLLASTKGQSGSTADSAQVSVMTDVILNLTGQLLSPEVNFAIQIPNLTADGAYRLITALNYIQSDQQEMNRQVFSLLLFNRFAPLGNFLGQGSAVGGVAGSVSDFVSSQFNSLLSQALGTDNLGVNVSSRDFNEVFLNVRAQLFNKRVTIERNGVLVSNRQRDFSLGNITVLIRVLPINTEKAKPGYGVMQVQVFQRENVDLNAAAIASVNRGVGIFLKQDFDSLAELFRRMAQNQKERREERERSKQPGTLPPPVAPSLDSMPPANKQGITR